MNKNSELINMAEAFKSMRKYAGSHLLHTNDDYQFCDDTYSLHGGCGYRSDGNSNRGSSSNVCQTDTLPSSGTNKQTTWY